jgi:hypothetical protein
MYILIQQTSLDSKLLSKRCQKHERIPIVIEVLEQKTKKTLLDLNFKKTCCIIVK